MQDRGLAAYIAELLGTLFLTFVVGVVVTLYVPTVAQPQNGADFAVVGLVHAFVLFGLIISFGAVSGGHFNPAVTVAAAALRRINPLDAAVYILAQLSGGVLGALLTKALLSDEGEAGSYGAATISPLLSNEFQGMIVEALGTFLLVLVICAVALNPRARADWAPLAIGSTLGFAVMIFGPLTGAALNPARWFGPALIGEEFGGTWPYLVGPLLGALVAAAIYRFVIAGPQYALGPEPPTTAGETAENVAAEARTAAHAETRRR